MKRILALLLAFLLLTGCSTGATEENTITTIAPTETEAEALTVPETESLTEVPTEESTEPTTEAETEAPTKAPTEQLTEAPAEPPATEPPATEHKHNYSSRVTAPTCTGKGYTTYTCTCGYSYKGSETPAKGHAYKDTVVEPTCTDKGYTEHKCQTCGHSYKDNETNATGHIISTVVIQQATCTETGLMQNVCENKGCSYTYDIEIEAKGHKYETTTVAPTTEAKGYDLHTCKTCGHSYKDNYTDKLPAETEPPHSHSYTSKVTKAATCTEDGVKTFTCSCGDSYTEAIPKTGHSYSDKVTAPTCTAKGYTTHTCGNCGHSYKDTETAALGHKWGDWVRTKEPTTEAEGQDTRTCSNCGATETRAVEKLPSNECTNHEYEWVCDSSWEFDTGTCKNCGATKVIYASSSSTSQAVVDAINAYRKAAGLSELQYDSRYDTRIKMRAAEITIKLSHVRLDGSQAGKAECIGAGYGSAQAAVDAWYNSSSHNGIIMNANATRAAAAYNGSYWVVWIM